LITVDRVRDIHRVAIELFGGSPSPHEKREGCLDSSIGAARSRCAYQFTEDDVLQWAAGMLFYLAKNHCMDDGNKRIAWMAAEDVLRSWGLRIVASIDEAEAFVLSVAAGKIDADEVAAWIADHLGVL
jgi:death-on-curing protein